MAERPRQCRFSANGALLPQGQAQRLQGRTDMNDTLLYRRFLLVVALIAATGMGIANLILETRTQASPIRQFSGSQERPACARDRVCLITATVRPLA